MKNFKFNIQGNKYEVSVDEVKPNVVEMEVNGTHFTVGIERDEKPIINTLSRKAAGKVTSSVVIPKAKASSDSIKSPLPGNVLKIAVTLGQTVKRGDLLLTLESMKMENNILAEKDGVVDAIHVQQGQSVMQNDVLFDIK